MHHMKEAPRSASNVQPQRPNVNRETPKITFYYEILPSIASRRNSNPHRKHLAPHHLLTQGPLKEAILSEKTNMVISMLQNY